MVSTTKRIYKRIYLEDFSTIFISLSTNNCSSLSLKTVWSSSVIKVYVAFCENKTVRNISISNALIYGHITSRSLDSSNDPMEEKYLTYLTSANRLAMMYGTELNPKHFGDIIFDEKRITYPIHISKTCLVKLNLTEQKSEIEDLTT